MSPSTVLLILEIVGALFNLVKDAPAVIDEIKSLLAKVAPHVQGAGASVESAFQNAEQKLKALHA